MKYTFILFLLIQSLAISGQENKPYRKLPFVSEYTLIKDTESPFYILQNPVTNKEYLTYLCWLWNNYLSYPSVVIDAFPGLTPDIIDSLKIARVNRSRLLTSLIKSVPPKTRGYMFNPAYIDYPVTDLTWIQAVKFSKWLGDRYNESILIKKGLMQFDKNQADAECFVTESYLANEYVGLTHKRLIDPITKLERNAQWNDRILYPAFRLPSQKELNIAASSIKTAFKAYASNDFLSNWTDQLLEYNKKGITFRSNFSYHVAINSTENPEITFPSTRSELFLDWLLAGKGMNINEIFKDFNQNITQPKDASIKKSIKNSLGYMPYVLIAEDENLNPVFIEQLYQETGTIPIPPFVIFRLAMNAVK